MIPIENKNPGVEVPDSILIKTTECYRNLECLKPGETPYCNVKMKISSSYTVVNKNLHKYCAQCITFGNENVCLCKIRNYLYDMYGF